MTAKSDVFGEMAVKRLRALLGDPVSLVLRADDDEGSINVGMSCMGAAVR